MARKKSGKGPAVPPPTKIEVVTPEVEPAPPAAPLPSPPPSTTDTAVEPEVVKPVEPEVVELVEPEAVEVVEPAAVEPVQLDATTTSGSTEPEVVEGVEQAASNETAVVNAAEAGEELAENLPLFPVPVKGPAGEEIELQINPGDTVMDIRQFLSDAPETCFYTAYDLILTRADGMRYHLIDYIEIGEVADVAKGGVSLEMFPSMYDERAVRVHMRKLRELVSTASSICSHSTALASEHETTSGLNQREGKPPVPREMGKPLVLPSELENVGYAESVPGVLAAVLKQSEYEGKECFQTMAFSSFNPVPGWRRVAGDLAYLDLVTVEGESYNVTAHTKGFFVNATTGDVLDPSPVPKKEAPTLVGLLRILSPKFDAAFASVGEWKAACHPYEIMMAPISPPTWLCPVGPETEEHRRNPGAAEEALTTAFGTETSGLQRDWNEELQSCRELPRATLKDRILRDRALFRVHSEFTDAAAKGARAVIGRCIPPLNPTDPERYHMYVHNSIFFSFAIDGDFARLQQLREKELKEKAAAEAEAAASPEDPPPTPVPTPEAPTPEAAEAVEGAEGVAEEGGESEQASYSSANNDLQGTALVAAADVAGLHTLAMAVVAFRGHRLVAQTIIPGILYGDKTAALQYGSVDNGAHIKYGADFHSKVGLLAEQLHLKEHKVADGEGGTGQLYTSVEAKGIKGTDDRLYLLDLMRLTPRDANFQGTATRLLVLRPELIAAYCRDKRAETHAFNNNVFTKFKLGGTAEEVREDEEAVRALGRYLLETAIPRLCAGWKKQPSLAVDGPTLSASLHAGGCNLRYLGKVAAAVQHSLPHIYRLAVVEMAVRSAKHVLQAVLRETTDADVGGATAHFINCFIGTSATNLFSEKQPPASDPPPPTPGTEGTGEEKPGYTRITAEMVWSDVAEGVKFKYACDLPPHVRSLVRNPAALRNLCLKLGVVLRAKEYDLGTTAPLALADVRDVVPIVKHVPPTCQDARSLLAQGEAHLQEVGLSSRSALLLHPRLGNWLQLPQSKLNEAYVALEQAYQLLQQVCGPLHADVATCCRALAVVLYHVGEMKAAQLQQHRELICNERVLGRDHPHVATSYANLALLRHAAGESVPALHLLTHALRLLASCCPQPHPLCSALYVNLASLYQDVGRVPMSLRYLQEAIRTNEAVLAEGEVSTAICYHALALAFSGMGNMKLAILNEKKALAIFSRQLGLSDPRTKDSQHWLQLLHDRDMRATREKSVGVEKMLEELKKGGKGIPGSMSREELTRYMVGLGGAATPKPAAPPPAPALAPPRRRVDDRASKAAVKARTKLRSGEKEARRESAAPPSLGAGLGVGLGAVSGAPPPPKPSARKATGEVAGPVGLGLGLEGKGSSRSKSKRPGGASDGPRLQNGAS